MKAPHKFAATALLLGALAQPAAADGCPREEVVEHVRQQYALYGPLSDGREYFGFIYRLDGTIQSAVTRSGRCTRGNCLTDTAAAAALIPRGAKILGEWHTHPHDGSAALSAEDVRGARNNAQIRCYSAYYSKPDGEILSWEPGSTSVPVAMASRESIGHFDLQVEATLLADTGHGR